MNDEELFAQLDQEFGVKPRQAIKSAPRPTPEGVPAPGFTPPSHAPALQPAHEPADSTRPVLTSYPPYQGLRGEPEMPEAPSPPRPPKPQPEGSPQRRVVMSFPPHLAEKAAARLKDLVESGVRSDTALLIARAELGPHIIPRRRPPSAAVPRKGM